MISLRILQRSFSSLGNLNTIPIIDLGGYVNNKISTQGVPQKVREVAKNLGFFYVKNHGVPLELHNSLLKYSEKFFSLPLEQKYKIHMSKGGIAWRGFSQFKQELTSSKSDLKEGIYLGHQHSDDHPLVLNKTPLHGKNLFPPQIPEFKSVILNWIDQMGRVGAAILKAIADSLQLNRDYFRDNLCKEHIGLLRIFHYPQDDNSDPSLWGVGQHTDYGLITILMITDKGLEVKNKKNEWIKIDPVENTFVINIGDMLERLTKGLYKSTPHRVKNVNGRSRYSVPYFYDPGQNQEIKELNFPIRPSEISILEETANFQRWDNSDLKVVQGIYGSYLSNKLSKIFPQLARETLKR